MSEWKKIVRIGGVNYCVKVSKMKNKKYTAYLMGEDNKLYQPIHFGDKRYSHYKDKLGYYSNLDTNDKEQRQRYRQRHSKDNIDNKNTAGYWAYHYLW